MCKLKTFLICFLLLGCWSATTNAQLQSFDTQLWFQGSAGIGIAPESNSEFGDKLTAGDFNCDGFDDAAIAAPREDLIGADDGGRVLVLYAASDGSGLSATDRQVWSQAGAAIDSDPTQGENFGGALATGDFNHDGCDDLAIGVPRDEVNGVFQAGAVHVIYGSAEDGLSIVDPDYWTQASNGIAGAVEEGDTFGFALAVGDYDNDEIDDLAIGAPGEDVNNGVVDVAQAGAIHVLFGGAGGLSTVGSVLLNRGTGLTGDPNFNEQLGSVMASGNFVGIIVGDELAVGVPNHVDPLIGDIGGVLLISDIDGAQFDTMFTQDSPDVPGAAEIADSFGNALAAGDFDGDGLDELAVGSIGEDIEAPPTLTVGAVIELDFDGDPMRVWLQDDLNPEQSESNDLFGQSLAAADFNADGIDDLAIGVPFENLGALSNAGLVHVLYGQLDTGLSTINRQIWLQTLDPSELGDEFGFALATGKFNQGTSADLLIGAPKNTVTANQTGSATVLYSRPDDLFADGFE